MPRGADDRFWREEGLPSVFKHTLLDKYVPQFAGMTGSRSTARKVVFLDGYAGRGRYGATSRQEDSQTNPLPACAPATTRPEPGNRLTLTTTKKKA
jgi:hypothetical protein